jgi:serine/threonine protein kinase
MTAQVWAPKFEGLISITFAHPNVVTTLDFCVLPPRPGNDALGEPGFGGQAWIVQQLCTRGTLGGAIDQGALRRKPAAPDGEADLCIVLELARQVAAGLAYLHSREMLHGDLNGANVLLDDDAAAEWGFKAVVTDYGLLRIASAANAGGNSTGTVSHM